jgi:hypothetical protein
LCSATAVCPGTLSESNRRQVSEVCEDWRHVVLTKGPCRVSDPRGFAPTSPEYLRGILESIAHALPRDARALRRRLAELDEFW